MGQARRKSRMEIRLSPPDPWLLLAAALLAAIGLIMVASASVAIAESHGFNRFHYMMKHVVALVLGVLLGFIAWKTPIKVLARFSPSFLFLSALALLLVFLPGLGHTMNGSTRWINLGFMQFQMVEAVKISYLIFLAGYISRHTESIATSFRGTIPVWASAILLAGLLMAQPDFGGAVLILASAGAMLWIGGARFRDLFATVLAAAPVMIWGITSSSYRMRRLRSFLDPWADPYDGGFQLTQALIAIGRGEWFGVGLGASVQKLFYLPEAHTDFILAVVAEELGFVGIGILVGLFALLAGRGLHLAFRALEGGQLFAGLLAFGISVLLAIQAVISMGVNLGILPTKGLTLPLISSGGSSVMITGLALGLLLRATAEGDSVDAEADVADAVDNVPEGLPA